MAQVPLCLTGLFRYPIKSTAGESLSNVQVGEEGLDGDRRYMAVRPDGVFLTARSHPHLQRISSTLLEDGIVLHHPSLEDLTLYRTSFIGEPQATQVWSDAFPALSTTDEADAWLSEALGEPARLLWLGERSPRYRQALGKRVSFADGYPLLLIGQASLDDLNARMEKPHHMSQFRPNLVVSSSLPFVEDEWHMLRIGEVELLVSKPCSRCVMVTVDPASGTFLPGREPLRTLADYRKGPDGMIYFGQNLVVARGGLLEVGAEVEVVS